MKRSMFGNWLLGLFVSGGLAMLWLAATSAIGAWRLNREFSARQFDVQFAETRRLVVLPSGEAIVEVTKPIEPTNLGIVQKPDVKFFLLDGRRVVDPKTGARSPSWSLPVDTDNESQTVMIARNFSDMPFITTVDLTSLPAEQRLERLVGPGRENWYYVRPSHSNDTGYIAGFRADRTRTASYLTPQGASRSKPDRGAGFRMIAGNPPRMGKVIGRHVGGWNLYGATEGLEWAAAEGGSRHAVWMWEADRRRVFEVSMLDGGSVRLARDFAAEPPSVILMQQQARPGKGEDGREVLDVPRGVLRFRDRLEFVDSDFRTTRTVKIPTELRDRRFALYETGSDFVVTTSDPEVLWGGKDSTVTIRWMTADGEITRHATWLAEWNYSHSIEYPLEARHMAETLSLMPIVPLWGMLMSPIVWSSMQQDENGVFRPTGDGFSLIRSAKAVATYVRSACANSGWQCLFVCGMSGLICAAIFLQTARRRGMHGAELLAWCGLVFLLGPAGLLGYRTHRPLGVHRPVGALHLSGAVIGRS